MQIFKSWDVKFLDSATCNYLNGNLAPLIFLNLRRILRSFSVFFTVLQINNARLVNNNIHYVIIRVILRLTYNALLQTLDKSYITSPKIVKCSGTSNRHLKEEKNVEKFHIYALF